MEKAGGKGKSGGSGKKGSGKKRKAATEGLQEAAVAEDGATESGVQGPKMAAFPPGFSISEIKNKQRRHLMFTRWKQQQRKVGEGRSGRVHARCAQRVGDGGGVGVLHMRGHSCLGSWVVVINSEGLRRTLICIDRFSAVCLNAKDSVLYQPLTGILG